MIVSALVHAHTHTTHQSAAPSAVERLLSRGTVAFVARGRPSGQQGGAHPGGAVVPLHEPVLRGLVVPSGRRVVRRSLSGFETFLEYFDCANPARVRFDSNDSDGGLEAGLGRRAHSVGKLPDGNCTDTM